MYLGRPEREMKPWYTDRELKRVEEKAVGEEAEYRRARDQYVSLATPSLLIKVPRGI